VPPPALGVSSFLLASGADGILGVPGVAGGSVGVVAGGPIGAEPEPVPGELGVFGNSAPGDFVPGCDPGTGDVGWANADIVTPARRAAPAATLRSLRIRSSIVVDLVNQRKP
jgi:hypothetical protein